MDSTERNCNKEEERNYLISEVHLARNKISNYTIIKSSVRKASSRQLKDLWREKEEIGVVRKNVMRVNMGNFCNLY